MENNDYFSKYNKLDIEIVKNEFKENGELIILGFIVAPIVFAGYIMFLIFGGDLVFDVLVHIIAGFFLCLLPAVLIILTFIMNFTVIKVDETGIHKNRLKKHLVTIKWLELKDIKVNVLRAGHQIFFNKSKKKDRIEIFMCPALHLVVKHYSGVDLYKHSDDIGNTEYSYYASLSPLQHLDKKQN